MLHIAHLWQCFTMLAMLICICVLHRVTMLHNAHLCIVVMWCWRVPCKSCQAQLQQSSSRAHTLSHTHSMLGAWGDKVKLWGGRGGAEWASPAAWEEAPSLLATFLLVGIVKDQERNLDSMMLLWKLWGFVGRLCDLERAARAQAKLSLAPLVSIARAFADVCGQWAGEMTRRPYIQAAKTVVKVLMPGFSARTCAQGREGCSQTSKHLQKKQKV